MRLERKTLKTEGIDVRRLLRKSQRGKPSFLREAADSIAPAQVHWRKRMLFISVTGLDRASDIFDGIDDMAKNGWTAIAATGNL